MTRAARTLANHRPSDARAQELTSCLSSAARSADHAHFLGLGERTADVGCLCDPQVTYTVWRCGVDRRESCNRNVILNQSFPELNGAPWLCERLVID